MVAEAYVQHIRAVMRAHGFYIQGVARSHPTDPTYWYTVGLQRLPVPRPEVIVFGLHARCAAETLRAVHDRVRLDGPLRPGEQIRGLCPDDPELAVRVDPVRARWVEEFAGMVAPVLRRAPADVPMLQLVLPDRDGRWPEDPAVDPELAEEQPLLAHAACWRAPISRSGADDLFFVGQPGSRLVAVPVPDRPEGRYELLRAERVTVDTVRLTDVPWAADHVASGDIVQTAEASTVPGLPSDTNIMTEVLIRGPWQTRAFGLPPHDAPVEAVEELIDTVWDLVDGGRTRASTTRSTLHVNTVEPARFDEVARPFVRDGLLVPRGSHGEADHFLPPGEECPDCLAARRAAGLQPAP